MTPAPRPAPSHPSKLFLLAAGSAATIALGLAGCGKVEPRHEPPAPVVKVIESRRMTLPIIVNPIGTTRALEDETIRARVKGFLKEKHFQDGGHVKAGQLLLVIDEAPFQLQLEQAEAQLNASEAMLRKATASKAAEVAKAQLELDRAQLLLDQVEERRARNLLARKAASQEDFDKADAQRKKSEAQVQADLANYEQTRADYTIEVDRAKADLDRAKAALEDARLNLGYCRMSAHISGRIGELKVKVGSLVGDGGATELVTIQQLDPMGLDFRPPARYLPLATTLLARGLKVELTVEGDRKHPHIGKAIFIDNVVDNTTSTFLMRAEVPNPDGSLLPGLYIRAGLIIGEYADAVVVPEQSVIEGQEGSRVFVVDADNTVRAVRVQPVDVYQGLRVLESGLESGQKVIVEGIQLVRADQKVEPVDAPLENYIRVNTAISNIDQRFTSKVSRLPGMEQGPSKTTPSFDTKGASPVPKVKTDQRSSPPPGSRTKPDPESPAAPGTTTDVIPL
jgi:membrane fusion protein (multidrug efflux system)